MITFHCRELLLQVGEAFLSLIEALHEPEVRNHPLWGKAIPFVTDSMGEGLSSRYCVRPDIVVTEKDGHVDFKIVEFNIFPAGRGIVLTGLNDEEKFDFLQPFAAWYNEIPGPICYAVGTDQMWARDAELFSHELKRFTGVNVPAINIDTCSPEWGVDRLFQPFQCKRKHTFYTGVNDVFPREGWLDAKTIMALIHQDESVGSSPLRKLSTDHLQLLRAVVPETKLLDSKFIEELHRRIDSSAPSTKKEARARLLNGELDSWMVKNGDVDTPRTFGARGVDSLGSLTKTALTKAAEGAGSSDHARYGRFPIVQRLAHSTCFREVRREALNGGRLLKPETVLDFTPSYPEASSPALGRLGPFLLLSPRGQKRVRVTPYAALCIGPSRIVHGAKDCVAVPAQIL